MIDETAMGERYRALAGGLDERRRRLWAAAGSQRQSYPNGTSATFTYDPTDSLTQIADKNGTSPLWTFGYTRDQNNQVVTASDPIDKLTHTESYDSRNRLTQDQTAASTFGVWGYDAANEVTTNTLNGLLDTHGRTQATYTYDSYGNVTATTGTVTNPFQYAGQYTDAESGLQYLRARYYDPNTQQFLTVDPMADQTGQPYGYAGDNPVNAIDTGGLCAAQSGARPSSFATWKGSKCELRFSSSEVHPGSQHSGIHFHIEVFNRRTGISST